MSVFSCAVLAAPVSLTLGRSHGRTVPGLVMVARAHSVLFL